MVFRDRLTAVDVYFGFQVDGKFSLKMLHWPQFGAVKREFRGSISLWAIKPDMFTPFLARKNSSPGAIELQFPPLNNQYNLCRNNSSKGIFGEIMSDSKNLKLSGDCRWLQKVALSTSSGWTPSLLQDLTRQQGGDNWKIRQSTLRWFWSNREPEILDDRPKLT